MKSLLYYPNFFIEDENWLKFALMYIDKVVTIIPNEAKININPIVNSIRTHTDLFDRHSPSAREVNRAARMVSEKIGQEEKNILTPYMTNSESYGINSWSSEENFNYELYSGKLPNELINMLIERGYAKQSNNGILVNENLAQNYMSILAHIISESENIPTITNQLLSDKLWLTSNIKKDSKDYTDKFITINKNLEIYLPGNIEDIPLSKFISFRDNEKVQKELKCFHNALDKFELLRKENISENKFFDVEREIKDTLDALNSEIIGWFGIVIGNSISSYMIIENNLNSMIGLAGPATVAGFSVYQGVHGIAKYREEYQTMNGAQNYITRIGKHFS